LMMEGSTCGNALAMSPVVGKIIIEHKAIMIQGHGRKA
jgi:hypothetical protein